MFCDANDLHPAAREEYLSNECGDDLDLKADVLQLLDEDQRTSGPIHTGIGFELLPSERLKPLAQVADRFEIVRRIGAGGMGEVYESYDSVLGEYVALKTVKASLALEPNITRRFKDEIKNGRAVGHPNICRIYEFVQDDSYSLRLIAFAMELLKGNTLAEHLRVAGPLRFDTALPLVCQMIAGLQALHGHDIIHRDFKSGNIMLCDDDGDVPLVKIMDFGLARRDAPSDANRSESLTRALDVMGTPPYMALEQFPGHPSKTSAATDVYALGVVMYEMATCSLPYEADDSSTLADKKRQPPVPPSEIVLEVDKTWEAAILRCLQSEPGDRPQNVSEVRTLLDTDPAITVAAPEPEPEPVKPADLIRVGFAIAAIVLLIGVMTVLGSPPVRTFVFDRACLAFPGSPTFCLLPVDKDVAMIPFENLSEVPDDRALAAGVVTHAAAGLYRLAPGKDSMCVHIRKDDRTYGMKLVFSGTTEVVDDRVVVKTQLRRNGDSHLLREVSTKVPLDDAAGMHSALLETLENMLEIEFPADSLKSWNAERTDVSKAFVPYLRGVGFRESLDYDSAVRSFEQAKDQDLTFKLAHTGMGDACRLRYLETGEEQWAEAAQEAFEWAHDVPGPPLAQTFFGLGQLEISRNRGERAIALYEQALELEPFDFDVQRKLAAAYRSQDQFDEEESANLKTVDLRPTCWYGHNHLGSFYSRNGRFREARRYILELIQQTQDNGIAYSNLAFVSRKMGRFEEAAKRAQEAIDNGSPVLGFANLGRARYFQRCYQASIEALERSLDLDENDPRIYYYLGEAYLRLGHDERSGMLFRQAIERARARVVESPDSLDFRPYLALGLARVSETLEAINEIDSANRIGPGNPEIQFFQAVAYELVGERQRALMALEAALRQGYSVRYAHSWPELEAVFEDERLVALLGELDLSQELEEFKARLDRPPNCEAERNRLNTDVSVN